MAKSTTSPSERKPEKPTKDFPLYAHRTKRWAKKVNGKTLYFGPWEDPFGALRNWEQYQRERNATNDPAEGHTVRDLLNSFLGKKQQLVDEGELTQRSFEDYRFTCDRIKRVLGLDRVLESLGPSDYLAMRADVADGRGVHARANELNRVRCVLKYAYSADLIDRPLKYQEHLKGPSAKSFERHRQQQPKKLFTPEQIKLMLEASTDQLKGMILLAINCGFGNHDCARVPITAFDFKNRWVDFPRVKTAIERRCPLWPETVAALQVVQHNRKPPKDSRLDDVLFLTRCGGLWADQADTKNPRTAKRSHPRNALSAEFTKLTKELGFYRKGVAFYALRHTFATVAGDSLDQVAVNYLMGHKDNSMAAVYREGIRDERLVAVTDHVHAWLFGVEGGAA